MKALEKASEIRATAAHWKKAFKSGSEVIGTLGGGDVFWHERLGIWGMFGKTRGRGGIERGWNPFGQKTIAFRSNMIVEINQPPAGIDRNLQGVFATDAKGARWILHQGRMSVSGSRVTESDFVNATGLKPTTIAFSDGSSGAYHKVAPLDASPVVLQEHIAAFVTQCAKARVAKLAPAKVLAALQRAQEWERGLSPETTGDFEVRARNAMQGRRRHGEVWGALSATLALRKIPHSNDRVAQYGPDLFTYGGKDILFEIKVGTTPSDIFGAVGQLHIYEQLLNAHFGSSGYRKALVVPKGMRPVLEGPLAALRVAIITYERHGRSIVFDEKALGKVLA